MSHVSRRTFLGASLAHLAAGSLLTTGGSTIRAAEAKHKSNGDASPVPDTLFLTWRTDPTTTMMIQWVGTGRDERDSQIQFQPSDAEKSAAWSEQPITTRAYPHSDLTLFRAELTGLSPGTDYHFKIGRQSKAHRFRTMPAKATDTIWRAVPGRRIGGKLRTPQTPEKMPHLAVTTRNYHCSLDRIQGDERFHLALDDSGRVMDVCRSGQRTKGSVSASG